MCAVLATVFMIASPDGELLDQDRLGVVHGRMARPDNADEAVMNARRGAPAGSARRRGHALGPVHEPCVAGPPSFEHQVGRHRRVQQSSRPRRHRRRLRLHGVDARAASARRLAVAPSAICAGEQRPPTRARRAEMFRTVERELVGLFPRGAAYEFHATGPVVTQVESRDQTGVDRAGRVRGDRRVGGVGDRRASDVPTASVRRRRSRGCCARSVPALRSQPPTG